MSKSLGCLIRKGFRLFYIFNAMFLVSTQAYCGDWEDIKIRTSGYDASADEYVKVRGGVVECDDDKGDAGAKTLIYTTSNGKDVTIRRCNISGATFGNDQWILEGPASVCQNNTPPANTNCASFSDYPNLSICVNNEKRIKQIANAIISEGGKSVIHGCVVNKEAQAESPEASTTNTCDGKALGTIDTIECKDIIQSNKAHATKCEKVCHECNDNKNKACWLHRIVECEPKYAPDDNKNKCVYIGDNVGGKTNSDKATCENSGGTWKNSACSCSASKNQKAEGNKCVCTSSDYEFMDKATGCKQTNVSERRTTCEKLITDGADGEPEWDEEHKNCICADAKYEFKTNKCIMKKDAQMCEKISDAKWSSKEEKCICKDSNKVIDEDELKCVESDEARKKREEAAELARQKAKQEESKANITSIAGKINKLKSDLNISEWKNKDGNFNTSRLVSDSVAGVVLGTAGGLITSNVIKKNQIKGGFEDISCTVGGQVVAGYGDEFRVGIQ